MKIRILLADDHPALLAGLTHELAKLPTLEIVGTAEDSDSLVMLVATTDADVLVTDYVMPGGKYGDGLGLLAHVRRAKPNLKTLVFTTLENPALTQELAKIGINGVLGKTQHTSQLISAIHAIYAGSNYFPTHDLITGHSSIRQDPSQQKTLTKREMEVLRLYISGMSVNEIAAQLNRTKQTISSQKAAAMSKLGITRDADLFRYAFESGLTSGQ
ncbi:LuxR family transcriptional regulator [Enterobacter cloacae subsp. cloacae]|uniref:response regulator transcription factor n=1 Tax=Enterobacter cloacae TaxID=550 RepID=UPI00063A8E24|nr:response regulator transcription factor [Enterobacter cloacae]KLG11720.1 LuxR family transcriptional regulator [Enterobacter cloacae subsp. cloacae]